MITLLTGENSFEIEWQLARFVAAFDGDPEKIDGSALEVSQLPDLLMGTSLFSDKRLVIIRGLASNKAAWEALSDVASHMSNDIHAVLIEIAVDKRTKTYKTLQRVANVKEYKLWSERDTQQAERWVVEEAKHMEMDLDNAVARAVVGRCFIKTEKGQMVIDQWLAMHALEKLSVFENVTAEVVEKYIDNQPVDTVFAVFETALKCDKARLHQLIADIEPREDPFQVFGLLSGQVFQLAALASTDRPSKEVAKAIGAHPFAVNKLHSYTTRLRKHDIRQIVKAFADADEAMKLSKAEPWVLIEQALMKVAVVVQTK